MVVLLALGVGLVVGLRRAARARLPRLAAELAAAEHESVATFAQLMPPAGAEPSGPGTKSALTGGKAQGAKTGFALERAYLTPGEFPQIAAEYRPRLERLGWVAQEEVSSTYERVFKRGRWVAILRGNERWERPSRIRLRVRLEWDRRNRGEAGGGAPTLAAAEVAPVAEDEFIVEPELPVAPPMLKVGKTPPRGTKEYYLSFCGLLFIIGGGALGGGALVVAGLRSIARSLRRRPHLLRLMGTIVSVQTEVVRRWRSDSGSSSETNQEVRYFPLIAYTTPEGKGVQFRSELGEVYTLRRKFDGALITPPSRHREGERIEIFHDSSGELPPCIANWWALYFSGTGMLAAGLVLLGLGVTMALIFGPGFLAAR